MDELLKPVTSTRTTASTSSQSDIIEVGTKLHITDSDAALKALKDSPDSMVLGSVLEYHAKQSLNATTAQITNVLIAQTVPDWWELLRNDLGLAHLRTLLIENLREITALSSLLSRVKVLVAAYRSSAPNVNATSARAQLKIVVDVVAEALNTDDLVRNIYEQYSLAQTSSQQLALWKEAVSLLASGRIVAVVAEAEHVLLDTSPPHQRLWISQGAEFCHWLSRNIAGAVIAITDAGKSDYNGLSSMLGKALALGYQDVLVGTLLDKLVLHETPNVTAFARLSLGMPAYQQRNVLSSVLRYLDLRFMSSATLNETSPEQLQPSPVVSDCAALVMSLVTGNQMLKDYMSELCIKIENSILIRSFALRRVLLASMQDDDERMESVIEKLLTKFGDQLFIRHAAAPQQEAVAQMILIAASYIHRSQPMLLFTLAKSSTQMHGISNRLKSPAQRAQWLGMSVGMALSELTDKPDSKLSFDDESMQTEEARWYQALIHVHDKIGNIDGLKSQSALTSRTIIPVITKPTQSTAGLKPRRSSLKQQTAITGSKPRIIEIVNDSEEDDEDLIPYAKPDSDREDEDDDPTLVERKKPRPPVYIRDLISGLRETENYEKHRLALETSTALIRRKANFGKEVSDHAEELLSVLLNMNDQFEIDNFLELRQEALISLLVSQPKIIGPSLARACFEGNFSVQQRTAMLTALALGSRQLSGIKDGDSPQPRQFPSNELPEHLQQIYGQTTDSRFSRTAHQLEQAMVEPLALQAADQVSGPNALKVRTFSSRMNVNKRKSKAVKTSLANEIAGWFIFPLIANWWTQTQNFASAAITFSSHLLPVYLRALAVMLHAVGPSTLALPQLTTEVWDILLSVRTNALHGNDVRTLDALLFALLTLLELNTDKQQLANEHAKELVETQEWAKLVLDKYSSVASNDDSESGKVKMMAAAVVVKCHEVVERWQRLMLGDLVDI